MFGEEPTLQFTRAVGSSMARVADAALSLFLVNVEGPIVQEGGGGDAARARRRRRRSTLLDVVPSLMAGLFRLHMQAAISRQRIANRLDREPVAVPARGRVRRPRRASRRTPRTSAPTSSPASSRRFEARANDVVAPRGGRVVKHIGDEVMFVEADPAAACDIALQLVESFGEEAGVAPHAGVGFGAVVARGGDYYGSVVNLASRIADLAVPGEVLVTEAVPTRPRSATAGSAFEPAGRRHAEGLRRADPAVVGHAIAPCSLSSATVAGSKPQSASASSVSVPGTTGVRSIAPGVRLKRGAGRGLRCAFDLGERAAGDVVRVLARLVHREDRREAHLVAGEELDPLVAGAGPEQRGHLLLQAGPRAPGPSASPGRASMPSGTEQPRPARRRTAARSSRSRSTRRRTVSYTP